MDLALVRLARAQQGVFRLSQIRAIGLSPSGVWSRVERHRLHRIHDGVYALVPEPLLTPNGRRMAAVLACGPGAGLSHHASLKLRGLRDSSRSRIDVTVPTRGGRNRQGIAIHRSTTLRPQDIELVQWIPCTTLARTIFDMAGVLTPRQLEHLLDEAAYQEVLDGAALDEQIEHNRGRAKACARLQTALNEHRAGSTLTDGVLGEEMLALIRSTDLPEPKVQHWIDLGDGEPMIQADFAWPEARVILETDGQQAHGQPRRTNSDYRRDQRAAKA
ncbi:MAG TPA: type IV toxin-antitoxin system AbiEi family antitoxin domain-containing protein, partial [Solirubrobacteraceae bacterium]|nr:type IV toxin-antitoxin system AbiEi family antitoxin domain-containing protein [Solirubrobacteraceae bacterium]